MIDHILLKILLIGSLSVFFFSSFKIQVPPLLNDPWIAPEWADTIKNPFPDEPLVLPQGEELYFAFCSTCHGETGYGDGAAGGALGAKPANFHEEAIKKQSDGALFWKLSTGRENMPPFGEVFSEEQRWQLVAYLRELGKTP